MQQMLGFEVSTQHIRLTVPCCISGPIPDATKNAALQPRAALSLFNLLTGA
jgi:hypothetical protein